MSILPDSPGLKWPLPKDDPWSTPFAESLLSHLKLCRGATLLDIACGDGIPAFYLAEQVGKEGQVLAIDLNPIRIAGARFKQQQEMPWLHFEQMDMKALPPELPCFDRITGNLSLMFFRPNRFEVLEGLIKHLKPGGQIVLSFPSLGTFDSLWQQVEQMMVARSLSPERIALEAYVRERPSLDEVCAWLQRLGLKEIAAKADPLEIATASGQAFLHHPLLRGGFLEDIYDCFEYPALASDFMQTLSKDIASFTPLFALRGVVSGWKK